MYHHCHENKSVWTLHMYNHTQEFVVMLKRPQRRHRKPTKMSNDLKEKLCGAGLATKVLNWDTSASKHLRAVSGPTICIKKVRMLQNESGHSFSFTNFSKVALFLSCTFTPFLYHCEHKSLTFAECYITGWQQLFCLFYNDTHPSILKLRPLWW